jgi:hypothetical protein
VISAQRTAAGTAQVRSDARLPDTQCLSAELAIVLTRSGGRPSTELICLQCNSRTACTKPRQDFHLSCDRSSVAARRREIGNVPSESPHHAWRFDCSATERLAQPSRVIRGRGTHSTKARLQRGRRREMRQILWSLSLVAFVCAVSVGLGAQAPASPAPQQPAAQQPASPPAQQPATPSSQASKQMTWSGCVEKAPAESGAAAASSTTFILTNAIAAGGSSAVGTAGSAKPAVRYRLDGDDAKISAQVGHKVEVTGTVEEQPSSAAPASGASASASTAPRLKVEAVKMVSATCP